MNNLIIGILIGVVIIAFILVSALALIERKKYILLHKALKFQIDLENKNNDKYTDLVDKISKLLQDLGIGNKFDHPQQICMIKEKFSNLEMINNKNSNLLEEKLHLVEMLKVGIKDDITKTIKLIQQENLKYSTEKDKIARELEVGVDYNLLSAIQNQKTQIENLKDAKKSLIADCNQRDRDLAKYKDVKRLIENQEIKLEDVIELRTKCESLESTNKGLVERNQTISSYLEKGKAAKQEAIEAAEKLKEEHTQYSKDLDGIKKEKESLEARLRTTEADNNKNKESNEKLSKETELLSKTVEAQTQELSKVKAIIPEYELPVFKQFYAELNPQKATTLFVSFERFRWILETSRSRAMEAFVTFDKDMFSMLESTSQLTKLRSGISDVINTLPNLEFKVEWPEPGSSYDEELHFSETHAGMTLKEVKSAIMRDAATGKVKIKALVLTS